MLSRLLRTSFSSFSSFLVVSVFFLSSYLALVSCWLERRSSLVSIWLSWTSCLSLKLFVEVVVAEDMTDCVSSCYSVLFILNLRAPGSAVCFIFCFCWTRLYGRPVIVVFWGTFLVLYNIVIWFAFSSSSSVSCMISSSLSWTSFFWLACCCMISSLRPVKCVSNSYNLSL